MSLESRVPSMDLRRQTGVGLVELMVAMAIGLMLVLMVTSYLISSRHSYQTSVANNDVQDARRFALHIVQQQLWLAGYSDGWEDISLLFPSYTPAEGLEPPVFGASQLFSAGGDEEVWIRYRAADLNAQPLTHCDGTPFPSSDGGDADSIAMTKLYLQDGSLRCKVYLSNGSTKNSLPLLNGVDALRWTYLDDSNAFQTFDEADWPSVKAVRLEMILASNESTGESFSQQFAWGDGTIAFEDGHARNRLVSTIALRNLPEAAQ